jgi:hypothetical protein
VNTLELIALIVVVLVVLLIAGGYVATGRRNRAQERTLRRDALLADQALASAHASDKGWDRETMEAAAREAAGSDTRELHLVQVVDRPGTEEDEAVFRVIGADGEIRDLRLLRRDGAWVPEGREA